MVHNRQFYGKTVEMRVKMNKCPFCESEKIIEFNETEYFQYGADPDGIVLSAPIVVEFCNSCDEKWTDWRSEDSRQKAVETHLATKGIYLCTVCKSVPVDVSDGVDTCGRCLLSQGIT